MPSQRSFGNKNQRLGREGDTGMVVVKRFNRGNEDKTKQVVGGGTNFYLGPAKTTTSRQINTAGDEEIT